jgi:hypothetical protein
MPDIGIPDLEFSCPDCPFCGKETNAVDGCFDCEDCSFTWARDGSAGQRMNDDLPQCTAERSPFADQSRYIHIRGNRYHCVLDEGHKLPHRGVRIDEPYRLDGTHEWSDADPVTV